MPIHWARNASWFRSSPVRQLTLGIVQLPVTELTVFVADSTSAYPDQFTEPSDDGAPWTLTAVVVPLRTNGWCDDMYFTNAACAAVACASLLVPWALVSAALPGSVSAASATPSPVVTS